MTTSADRARAELDALAMVAAWRQRDDLGTAPLAELLSEYVAPGSPALLLVLALVGQVSQTSEALCEAADLDVDEFFHRLGVERSRRVTGSDDA